jgi:hypothetical protein
MGRPGKGWHMLTKLKRFERQMGAFKETVAFHDI